MYCITKLLFVFTCERFIWIHRRSFGERHTTRALCRFHSYKNLFCLQLISVILYLLHCCWFSIAYDAIKFEFKSRRTLDKCLYEASCFREVMWYDEALFCVLASGMHGLLWCDARQMPCESLLFVAQFIYTLFQLYLKRISVKTIECLFVCYASSLVVETNCWSFYEFNGSFIGWPRSTRLFHHSAKWFRLVCLFILVF